ncbi:MAG TPA: hypothetical protein VEH47_04360 [Candidatus Acidoferrales bacterium]|nr:hypothetical protein [Candidatus Acidoferrales bacterium]
MRKLPLAIIGLLWLTAPLAAQQKRLWVLRSPGEMVEYDPATFAAKQTVKVPDEALHSPQSIAVNHLGQILSVPAPSLPLAASDMQSPHMVWLWNGKAASTLDRGVTREVAATGSNQAVTESAPSVYLSADGQHLFWFSNLARRLQREDIDLSVADTWQAWQTDLNGAGRDDLASVKLPECRCPTGTCEESCPFGLVWVPDGGAESFFLMTQFVAGKTESLYKTSTLFKEEGGKWTANPLLGPLRRVLDAASGGSIIVEAIPDTGCCGWSNQSNDQTLVHNNGKTVTIFDEQATYNNADYDVSFFTSNARLSPELGFIAMTIAATAQANQPIQLSEQGQADPEESKQIRKALAELPAVEVKTLADPPRRVAFLPHATLVGWLNERELLLMEDRVLVAYNVKTTARRRSNIRVEDAAHVYLR